MAATASSGGSALSPQSRRGRAAPPSHRKPSAHGTPTPAHPATPASRKPAAAARAVEAVEAVDEEQFVEAEAAPVPSKREGKPVRRKRSLAKAKKSPYAKYGGEWVKAYAPLFAAAIVGFFALWAWISFGPHTPTPKDNWTQIETVWKPKRDADMVKVSAAVKSGDFTAEIAAYKQLRDDTSGWVDAINKITSWGDPTATAALAQTATPIQAIGAFTADGQTIVTLLNTVVAAQTPNDILAQQTALLADEQAFATDYASAVGVFNTTAMSTSAVPTLAFPPGTYVAPTPSPSGSAGPSGSPSPS
jgi:hypothetical protein